jgi:hypothetical protein
LAFVSCYGNKRLAIWPTFLVWVIMVSSPFRFFEFGVILESRYFGKEDVRLNEAQIANIVGKRRKGLY